MCTVSNLQKMADTNKMIMSLVIEQLINFGQEKEKVLLRNSSESVSDTEEVRVIELSKDKQSKFNDIFVNLIQLASGDDEDSIRACTHYISSFKDILISYPPFEKIEMTDGIKKLYDVFCSDSDACEHQDLMLGISEIKNLLYK